MNDKLAIVTGASSGVGLGLATRLAAAGVELILPVRDAAKRSAAVATIKAEVPSARVRTAELDLASLKSVAAFAATVERPVHILVNNAGVMAPPVRHVTADCLELQFGTTLTGLYAAGPNLGRSKPARLAAVTAFFARLGIFVQGVDQGLRPTLYAATDPSARGGRLYGPDGFGQFTGGPAELALYRPARSLPDAARLWDVSAELVA
ncbi:SDR family NAD(P)-dependent oxidoreductase [Paractinoplanes lichenicola]|uniref:SDR family NAD(P)-dependent oxidoreductase n=1 Tax=Paractinoplanes lichenicola TaxID=2802976 RepID=UPI0027DAE31C|nr:SDR family NAD(P)-dependent oxidoreductase [Actinoplanes lichenicola]